MSRKITPEGQHLNVAAMAWWRYWKEHMTHPMPPALRAYYMMPATQDLVEACADLEAAQLKVFAEKNTAASFVLAHGEAACPPTCELRDVRHAHGTRLYEPSESSAQGKQLDGDPSTGSVEQQ